MSRLKSLTVRAWTSLTIMAWTNQAVAMLWMVGILPFVLRTFTQVEIAFWLGLSIIQNFASLADFGFRTTIIRAYAYFLAGHERLPSTVAGAPAPKLSGAADPAAIVARCSTLYSTSRRLYLLLAAAATIVALAAGPFVTWSFLKATGGRWDFIAALVITACTVGTSIHSFGWTALLEGSGNVLPSLRISILAGLCRLVAAVAAVLSGGGLVALALAGVFQQVVLNVLLKRVIARKERLAAIVGGAAQNPASRPLLAELWPASWRMAGVMGLGYFVYQAVPIVAARQLPVAEAASFLLLLRLLQVTLNLARSPIASSIPQFATLRARGEERPYRSFLLRKVRFALAVQVLAVSGVVFVAPWVLSLLHARTPLPSLGVMLLLGGWTILDAHHNAHATSYFTTNRNALLVPVAAAAVLVCVLAPILVRWGSLGLAIAQIAAQLVTVHWIAVRLNLVSLGWKWSPYFRELVFSRSA